MSERSPSVRSLHQRRTPPRVLALSLLALSAPVAATSLAPEWVEGDGALLVWIPALLPPFLLAYFRGWNGASLAVAGGMAALALTQVETLLLDVEPPPPALLFGVIVLLLAVCVGAGWVAERLHQEREAAEREALTDPLTGLPNRRHASAFLDAAWGGAQRGRKLSVVLFDLDRFKQVNDTHGHAEGDRVLRGLAEVLVGRTRKMDFSGRFGGEEFISILVDCDMSRAEAFAEEVRGRVAELDFGWGKVTLSAGVSAAERAMGSPDVLVAAADRALYAAKERGRNQVARADPAWIPVTLPAPQEWVSARARTDLDGVRVLLVDDDDLTLRSTARLLQRLGCEVTATGAPREALARLAGTLPVDILVTDIIMPDMSGFTLADLASKARPALRVLYVSGYPREEVYWGGTPGTRSAFLGKPLEAEELRTALLGVLHEGEPPPERTDDPPADDVDALLEAPLAEGSRPLDPPPRMEGRILVVDDDAAVVASLQRLFSRAGYARPIGLTDSRRVVDTLRSEDVDLMILDLHMGEMGGFEVLAAISELFGQEEFFPVVMLTGSDDPLVRRRALAAGAMDFLSKPFDPAEAEARVRNLLATRFLTQRVAQQRDTLEEEVAARTAELADTRSEILYRLARAAEYRDDVTGRHAERVGLLSSALASALGLPPRDADLLRRTAPLHDIGKIGVPDAILLKPGRLSAAEFEVMKGHTIIGAQILGGSPHRILEVARVIALRHHERWDGLGYPGGLRGEEAPLEARIVAVADTFDTITHARPYKAALAPEEAMAEIARCRGSHYDPGVVDALVAVKDRVGFEHLQEIAAPLDPLTDTLEDRPPRAPDD